MPDRLFLAPNTWFGWQVIREGQPEDPPWQCTPIYVTDVRPLKTGKGILRVSFIAALARRASKQLKIDLRVGIHTSDCIIAEFSDGETSRCVAVIRAISLPWIQQYCAELWSRRPPERIDSMGDVTDVDVYLTIAFGDAAEGILHGASESSFNVKLRPLPRERTRISVQGFYEGLDAFLIRRGSIPLHMEDHWFIFFKDGKLRIYRSWTGICIYVVVFEEQEDALRASHALVNRNRAQYGSTSDGNDEKLVRYLIQWLLVGKEQEFPDLSQ